MRREYMILSAMHVETLLNEINELAKQGWRFHYVIQEHAYSKVILELEKES